ncbi:hypothetical protein D3C85_989620 [compost metagenome]
MEHKTAWHDIRQALLGFLLPAAIPLMAASAPLAGEHHYPLVERSDRQRIAS